ncbi:MAG: adenylyltransferase/cytidyltransferase family protein [Bacteroidota bacterium]
MYVDYTQYQPLFTKYGIEDHQIIIDAWNEPHRFYHTEKHLKHLLDHIEQGGFTDEEKEILTMVAFMHDVVYQPNRDDNEAQSVAFFEKHTQPTPHTAQISQIIHDTKDHQGSSELSKTFCEMDMDIVHSTSFKELWEWEKGLFKEFQCYDYSLYKQGRIAVLSRFKEKYPQNASNLQALIDYLKPYKPKIGVYPGSFNPFHNGHLNILEKAEQVFDKVIIARGINPEKETIEKGEALSPVLYYRQIEGFQGLLTDYITSKEAHADVTLIRGLRNGDDLAYEMNQLNFMRDMKADLKTVFFHCDREFEHISSSAIRNLEKIGKGYGEKYLPE